MTEAPEKCAFRCRQDLLEPIQAVESRVAVRLAGFLDELIPLLDKVLQVFVDVGLKLAHRLGGKGVRNDLSLARVFVAVSGVEETAADGDKGVIEGTKATTSVREADRRAGRL